MLRTNSRLRRALGEDGYSFLTFAAQSIDRLLPHVDVSEWEEVGNGKSGAHWGSEARRHINVSVRLRVDGQQFRTVRAEVRRRAAPTGVGRVSRTLDEREHDICARIAVRLDEMLNAEKIRHSKPTLAAIRARFDGDIIAAHLEDDLKLEMDLGNLFDALRGLAGETYENRAIAFGCLLDPGITNTDDGDFPGDFFRSVHAKRFKALTDGFRTCYRVSASGWLVGIIDLDEFEQSTRGSAKDMYPEWAAPIARASRDSRCGVCLTRAGDILVFEAGSLRFTYRFGKWRYLNHRHIVDLLTNVARVQRVPRASISRVVRSMYRTALDVSFRRSGGLIVLLRSENKLHDLVRRGDAITDTGRPGIDAALDPSVRGRALHNIPRRIVAELAGLDGAVVVANSGQLLAYGAILQPKKKGGIGKVEGSRSKAAVGASNYGLALKISSDGDITAYSGGDELIRF